MEPNILFQQGVCFLCWLILSAGSISRSEKTSQCGTLEEISQKLWTSDVNRMAQGDITLNYQSKLRKNNRQDQAQYKLFTSVNETKFAGPTFRTFLALLDNYTPDKGRRETVTVEERGEMRDFLTAVLSTDVSNVLLEYFICTGIVKNQDHLRSVLTKIWFDFYPRSASSAVNDSSGLEHVLVGEYKSSSRVNGFHNWLSFYYKEKKGNLNYHGYVTRQEPALIGVTFKWNGRFKPLGTFFVGVSPEFDLAIYTLCYLTNCDRRCQIVINDRTLYIQTYNSDGHIGTAYIDI